MENLSAKLRAKIQPRPLRTILRQSSSQTEQEYQSLPKAKLDRPNLYIPDTFDGPTIWKDFLSPALNQKSCGSCWAFASTGTLADRFNIQSLGKMHVKLSPTRLILCSFQAKNIVPEKYLQQVLKENSTEYQTSACHGNTLYNAWEYLYVVGTNTLECLPYDTILHSTSTNQNDLPFCFDVTGNNSDMCADHDYNFFTGEMRGTPARFFRCTHFFSVAGVAKDGGSERNIRHIIYAWGPVSTGFVVYPDFYTFDPKKEIYRWNGQGKPIGGHAVEIVGWGIENNVKYWIIKNSWGPNWGNNGYFRIVRGENHCQIEENTVAGIPDFFFHPSRKAAYEEIWAENKLSQQARRKIMYNLNSFGGGIDPTTGYSRRSMYVFPWIDFDRPVNLNEIPDFSRFVAGKVVSFTQSTKNFREYILGFGFIFLILLIFAIIAIRRK